MSNSYLDDLQKAIPQVNVEEVNNAARKGFYSDREGGDPKNDDRNPLDEVEEVEKEIQLPDGYGQDFDIVSE